MGKFGKNRSVYERWLNVPAAYALRVKGGQTAPKEKNSRKLEYKDLLGSFSDMFGEGYLDKLLAKFPEEVRKTFNELYKKSEEAESIDESWKYGDMAWDYLQEYANNRLLPELNAKRKKNKDKEFTVIEFYGKNKALCGWRNVHKCNMGMTFICPIITKKGKRYIKYKNQLIDLSKDLCWVL